MRILGIETSCDETAAAVIKVETHGNAFVRVRSNVVSSQINIHKKYGGVVPEVAAREHVLNILPVINEALVKAGVKREDLTPKPHPSPPLRKERGLKARRGRKVVDVIAVTIGPGLITSLLVGIETAKVLSYAWNVPVVGVNHIEGHIYANFIKPPAPPFKRGDRGVKFPALILTVSGGHTMLVLMKGHGKYKTIGETRDDAAGEAFDKAAAMLGIGYPGGPCVAFQATKIKNQKSKIKNITLPRPMIDSLDYDFSFSGLKTALLYELKKDPTSPLNSKGLRGASPNWKKRIPEYSHEFQQAIIDVLIVKTVRAAKDFKVKTVMLSGGVAANKELRNQLKSAVKKLEGVEFIMPDLKYTTDNAAMIAVAGYFKALRKQHIPWQKLRVDCNAEL